MKNLLVMSLCSLLILSCAGRPPVPVDKYDSKETQLSKSAPHDITPLLKRRGAINDKQVKAEVGAMSSHILTGQEVFKKCNTAVFMVFTSTGISAFQGSGFFLSPEGLAVSNYHVFEGTWMGLELIKTSDGREYKLDQIVIKDKSNDVMVFTVKAKSGTKFNYIPLSSHNPQIGDKVYTIGSPRGLENTFSSGEISQFRENGSLIQISAPIDHGSSGGALINEYGEAIGITCSGYDSSGANLNFAVNIKVIKNRI